MKQWSKKSLDSSDTLWRLCVREVHSFMTAISRITIVPVYHCAAELSIMSAEQLAYLLTVGFGPESVDDSVDNSVEAFGDILQPYGIEWYQARIVHRNTVHLQLENGERCEQRVDHEQENCCSPTLFLTVGDDHSSHPHQLLEYKCKRKGSKYQREVTKQIDKPGQSIEGHFSR